MVSQQYRAWSDPTDVQAGLTKANHCSEGHYRNLFEDLTKID